jgi:hypothetical protein
MTQTVAIKNQTMRYWIGLFILFVLSASPTAKAQGNLIVNGTFDSDSGWATNISSGYYSALKGDPDGCFNLAGSISQTIGSLVPGASYLVSGSYDLVFGTTTGGPGFGVDMNGVSYYSVAPTDYAWHDFSFNYTATSSSVVLSLNALINESLNQYRIDNISVVAAPVPEPGVSTLALVALPALFWQIQRLRRQNTL